MHGGERCAKIAEFLGLHFADEFQSDVKIFRAHPAWLRRERSKRRKKFSKILSYRRRNLQCHEQTHRSRPFATVCRRLPTVVEKMNAHHVQSELRRVPANGFAVTGEAHAALFHSARMRNRDVHRANGFFFASAARSGDPRDATT